MNPNQPNSVGELIESLEALKEFIEAQMKRDMESRDIAKLEIMKRMAQGQTKRKVRENKNG
jgi:hypothetical protein